jgi:ubiquinone/menaquinone biosynthesis C-methylase UbiE
MPDQREIKKAVRERYAESAKRAGQAATSCCASGGCASAIEVDTISTGLYSPQDLELLPEEAAAASLGCGNPVARAELREGETVLDLGSGGGIDVILSSKMVGPKGKAYGLDMTEEMLALARDAARKAEVANAEFLKGEMEDVPLPDATVDVIISNCVVNLSPDKDAVLREAYRVLKPGGRVAIADIVVRGEMPGELKQSLELWAGCIAGALEEVGYRRKLAAAGFTDIDIEVTRRYTADDIKGTAAREVAQRYLMQGRDVSGGFVSAMVRARKP